MSLIRQNKEIEMKLWLQQNNSPDQHKINPVSKLNYTVTFLNIH